MIAVAFRIKTLKTSLSFKFLYHEPYKIGNFKVTEYVLFYLFVISIVFVMSTHMYKRNKTNYSAIFDQRTILLMCFQMATHSNLFTWLNKQTENIISHVFCHQFHWYATIESNLLQAFGDLLLSIMHSLHGAIRMPDLFLKIWLSLCSLFIQHSCLLFFEFTLASGLFAHGVFACAWV